jgi:hypothetical protein
MPRSRIAFSTRFVGALMKTHNQTYWKVSHATDALCY